MKQIFASVWLLLACLTGNAQLLSWAPQFPDDGSAITIIMDANFGNKGLLGQTPEDVYVHTGTITTQSTGASNWKYVKSGNTPNLFNTAVPELKATALGNNKWSFTIPNIRSFYGVPEGEAILKISILFRNGSGNKVQRNADGSDMFVPLSNGGLQVRITTPFKQPTFLPKAEAITAALNQPFSVEASSSSTANLQLLYNGTSIASTTGTTISAAPILTVSGNQRIIALADGVAGDTIDFYISPSTNVAALPNGLNDGPNYSEDNTSVTLVLFAPDKSSVVVVGDFNDWTPSPAYQMNRTPDGLRYWLKLPVALLPGSEYGYQFLIDGTLQVSDYMTQKVLDGWNDPYINTLDFPNRYPGLKSFPSKLPNGMVSVLEPGKSAYNWSSATTGFSRPDKRNLIMYELHLRDFLVKNNWKTLMDTLSYISNLGINAIELMPFTEFEGNSSWGYNPAYMFAADKFYGPENDLKRFVDSCHGRGIAVMLDMVLNHQFGQSPMAQMYFNSETGKPAANNPWLNQDATHPFNVGYDMNHEAPATIKFVEDVMRHWLVNFRLDGFRWDLSKGFTQKNSGTDVAAWGNFDQSRVNIWQRIYNQSQAISPNCYMVLEHLGNDDEESALARMGMMLWGKMTDQFNQMTMGYQSNSDLGRSFAATRWANYGANPPQHLVAYAESHDEERLMYKNLLYGNASNSNNNAKSLLIALKRSQMVPAFLLTTPGPKIIWQFQELGYDQSINRCTDGTIADCRLDPKPVLWNYRTVNNRINLMNMYARMARLRTKLPDYASTFTNSDVSYSLDGLFKWQIINGPALDVVVVGNMDVFAQTGTVSFPATGTWYNYASNISLLQGDLDNDPYNNVNPLLTGGGMALPEGSPAQSFTLQPGEFMVFTNLDVNTVLPLRLASFSGYRQSAGISLTWLSENENNTSHFEVERAVGASGFVKVGQVVSRNAGGNLRNNYTFLDADPVVFNTTGKITYRLKMLDKDGSHAYSRLVLVAPSGKISSLTVLPNPITRGSKISFETGTAAHIQINLLNGTGQKMGTIFNGRKGSGTHTIPIQNAGVNLAGLAKGLYFIQVIGDGHKEAAPVMIEN